MYLATLDQASGIEALPRAGGGTRVVWRLTQPTCLSHVLEEILKVRFGMEGDVSPGQEANLGELVAPQVRGQAQGQGLCVATPLGWLWKHPGDSCERWRAASGAGAAEAPMLAWFS